MEHIPVDQLPTTTIGLIGFMVVVYVLSMAWLVRYFMRHIAHISTTFAATIERITSDHAGERREMEARLRECLVAK